MNVGSRLYTPGSVMVEVGSVTTSGPVGMPSLTDESVLKRSENCEVPVMVTVAAWTARPS